MATHHTYTPWEPSQLAPGADWVADESNQSASTSSRGPKHETAYIGVSEWSRQPLLPLPPAVIDSHRKRLFWWAVRYAIVFITIFVALLVPIIVFSKDVDVDDDATIETIRAKQYRNLVFYITLWLEVTWVFAIFFDIIGLTLPYLFRFIARYLYSRATH